MAYEVGSEPILVSRDALMQRAVEQQINAFASVHDTARKQYLYNQWTHFLQRAQQSQNPGSLTSFLGDLQRAETTSIFIPKKMFRQLSPGNPYAAKQQPEGHHEEVQPQSIALRLISCREQLAEYWVELMPSVTLLSSELSKASSELVLPDEDEPKANATAANATSPLVTLDTQDTLVSYDKQLLLATATKLGARQMLRELSLRPSCQHLYDWLKSYLLVQHANELTAMGSVERLHADLVSQPVCIRGGAIFDPQDVSLELFQRSFEILEYMEEDLKDAPSHILPLTTDFLESCFRED